MPKTLAFAAVALALLGCTDKPIEPPRAQPGSFLLTLATPHTDDGALFFELRGPDIMKVRSAKSTLQLFADSSGTTIRGAMFGPLAVGAVVRFDVPDTTRLAEYAAVVLDVAAADNSLRASLTGYSLHVAR